MDENRQKLQDRLCDIEENRKQLDMVLAAETEEAQKLMSDLSQLKPEVRRLNNLQEEVKL